MNALDRLRRSRPKNWSPYLCGMASIFDFTGILGPRYKSPSDPQKAAAAMMARSWQAVGDALREAIGHHQPEAHSRSGRAI